MTASNILRAIWHHLRQPPPASKKGTHGEACKPSIKEVNTVTPFKALTPCSLATLHPTPLRRRQPEMWSNYPVDPSGTSWVSEGSIPLYMLLICPVWKYNFLLLLSLMAWQPTLLAILQALQLTSTKDTSHLSFQNQNLPSKLTIPCTFPFGFHRIPFLKEIPNAASPASEIPGSSNPPRASKGKLPGLSMAEGCIFVHFFPMFFLEKTGGNR